MNFSEVTIRIEPACILCGEPATAAYGDLAVCEADYEALAGPWPEEEAGEVEETGVRVALVE